MAAVGGRSAHVVDRARRRRRRAPGTLRARPAARVTSAGTGPAEPNAARISPRSRSTASASEQTAITIAFRGPTFMNVCRAPRGRHADGDDQLVLGERVRFGPTRNSASGDRPRRADAWPARPRRPRRAAAAARRRRARPCRGCRRSCRGCGSAGEPTVREASASAGRSSASSPTIASAYVSPAPSRSVPFSRDQPRSSPTSFRLRIASGRARSKLSATMTIRPALNGHGVRALGLQRERLVQRSRRQNVHRSSVIEARIG